MIDPVPSATVQKLVVGQQRNRLKATKRGNSDVPKIIRKLFETNSSFHLN